MRTETRRTTDQPRVEQVAHRVAEHVEAVDGNSQSQASVVLTFAANVAKNSGTR